MTARKSEPKTDDAGRKVDDAGLPLGGEADKPHPGLQAAADKANDVGHLLVAPDPTPNEHYTIAGVIAGKPTPETDADAAAAARQALDDIAKDKF